MRNKEILKLVAGFRRFRSRYFLGEGALYHRLSTAGQNPKTLIIGCSDSRVDPALISSASPGEIFVVRNVANLVPPYESANTGYHGISAAIEFSVVNLKVENIVVLGHRQCGGIRALVSGQQGTEGSFVGRWMEIARSALNRVEARSPHLDLDGKCKECEMEGIITSLENLKTFPFVAQAVQEGRLSLFGIYFDLEQGQLFELEESANSFRQIEIDKNIDRSFLE
ncbi:MAG: carbonic anhydrase [Bdellovibrionales bacterium]